MHKNIQKYFNHTWITTYIQVKAGVNQIPEFYSLLQYYSLEKK